MREFSGPKQHRWQRGAHGQFGRCACLLVVIVVDIMLLGCGPSRATPTPTPLQITACPPGYHGVAPFPGPATNSQFRELFSGAAGAATANGIVFSHDGHYLAASTRDALLLFQSDSATWGDDTRLLWCVGTSGPLRALEFSLDGQNLFTGAEFGWVGTWDVADGRPARVFQDARLPGTPSAVTQHPGDPLVAVAYLDGQLGLWRINDGTLTMPLAGQQGVAGDLRFIEQGTIIRAIVGGGRVRKARGWFGLGGAEELLLPDQLLEWRISDGIRQRVQPLPGTGNRLTPDGQTLFTRLGNDAFRVSSVDATGLSLRYETPPISPAPYSTAFSRDSRLVVWGDQQGGITCRWVANGTLAWSTPGLPTRVTGLAITPDSRAIASTGADGSLRLWYVPALGRVLS